MSTSTSIVSLAADLVVFLAAASFLLVLVLRSDLLGVAGLFRTGLAVAATLLAAAALIHGGLDVQGNWLSTLRLAAVVFLAGWQLIVLAGGYRPFVLPGPVVVGQRLVSAWADGVCCSRCSVSSRPLLNVS